MASAPTQNALPLFYNDLVPLNSDEHQTWKARTTDKATWIANANAIPLTVEEFPLAQRDYPIVFSAGPDPVPLALMGLNDGVNVFVDADGTVGDVYVPAYVRRYPFMLAKLREDTNELSLCFDPQSGLIGEFEDGASLFDGDKPSEACVSTLKFCEQFEIAGQKTAAFVRELKKHDLLTDGELTLKTESMDKPFVYRGFQMVEEKKLRELRGDVLRSWNQNGLLPLIFAHLFSLSLVTEVFGKQQQQGKSPVLA